MKNKNIIDKQNEMLFLSYYITDKLKDEYTNYIKQNMINEQLRSKKIMELENEIRNKNMLISELEKLNDANKIANNEKNEIIKQMKNKIMENEIMIKSLLETKELYEQLKATMDIYNSKKNSFVDSCSDYYNKSKIISIRNKQYDTMLLKTRKKIDEIKAADPANFLQSMDYWVQVNTLYAIFSEKVFVELLEKSNIRNNCIKLKNLMGGGISKNYKKIHGGDINDNNMSIQNKMIKYLYKYEKDKKINYGQKILRYMDGENIQNGGSIVNTDNIAFIISKILETDILLMPDVPKYNALNDPLGTECDDPGNYFINSLYNSQQKVIKKNRYLDDTIICNKQYFSQDPSSPHYNETYEFYLLKRKLKDVMTDSFIQSLTDDKYYKLLHYIFFILNLYINKFIDIYNTAKNPNPKLGTSDLFVLYKGGNTLRQQLIILLKNLGTNGINASDVPILNELLTDNKRGDFDFTIVINNKHTHIKNLAGEYVSFVKKISQIINVALIDIKNNISFIENGYSNATELIKKKIGDVETYLNKYLSDFNTRNAKSVTLKKFTVKTNSNIFEKNIVRDNNTLLEHKSYIVKKPQTVSGEKFNKMLYYETENAIFADNDLNIYQNSLTYNDNIFVSYIEEIMGTRFIMFTQFSLFRLKIENKISIEFSDGTTDINEDINIPIELIDVSIASYRSTKLMYMNEIKRRNPTLHLYNEIKLSKTFDTDTIENILKIPSSLYMFYDIAIMIFYEQVFVWEDLKFEKRIRRIIWYLILHYLSIGTPINTIITNMTALETEFTNMKNRVPGDLTYRTYLRYDELVDSKTIFLLNTANKTIDILFNEILENLYRSQLVLDFLDFAKNNPAGNIYVDHYAGIIPNGNIAPGSDPDYDNCYRLLQQNLEPNIDTTSLKYNATTHVHPFTYYKDHLDDSKTNFGEYIDGTIITIQKVRDFLNILATKPLAAIANYNFDVDNFE